MNKQKILSVLTYPTVVVVTLLAIIISFNRYYLNANVNNDSYYLLNGKVIFVDPGHGGHDNGTSWEEILEDEINLSVAKKLYEKLVEFGAIAYISRNSDYDLASFYARSRKDEDMRKRVSYINSTSPDLFVSIHLNYFPNPNVSGAQVFYNRRNEKGKLLANCLQDSLNDLNKKNKVAKSGDYYLTNNSIYPGVIVECGFISNYQDRKKLTNENYQYTLVNKIIKGIINYLELS